MRVLISTQCMLPVPAVKGGAVPTLIDSLIKENEMNNNCKFTIITTYDKGNVKKYKTYKNTEFVVIKHGIIVNIIDNTLEKILSFFKARKENFKRQYLWKLIVLYKTKRIMLKNQYDKVIFENNGFLLKCLNSKKISKRYCHNVYYHLHNSIPKNINLKYLNSCKTIVVSDYIKKNVLSVTGRKYESNISVLKNGINLNKFYKKLTKQESLQLRKKLNIKENDKVILFVGRISPEKGIEELIDAFSNINNKEYKLLIIGSHNFATNDASEFSKMIEKKISNLQDRIVFTGYVNHDDLWKYYQIVDLAVLPSTWEEPAGLTMLETVASEIPLVTTYSGGIPEYIPNNAAIFLNIDDNLVKNIQDSINKILNRQIILKNDKKQLNEFSEQNFYKNFIKIITKSGEENDENETFENQ